jgi:hypothetical protein
MKKPESEVKFSIYQFTHLPDKAPWQYFMLFAFFLCTAGISWAEGAASEHGQAASRQPVAAAGNNALTELTALTAKARAKGQIPVIARLNVDFQLERTLPSAAINAQRNTISNARNSVIRSLAGKDVSNIKNYHIVPYLALTVNENALQALAKNPMVSGIHEDVPVPPTMAQSAVIIGAETASGLGFNGNGWAVAVLDTGVDKNHNFLSGKVVSEACYSTNGSSSTSLCPGGAASSTATDSGLNCAVTTFGCKHGTHVAGTIAGKDYTPNGPGYNGVARGANIIAIQVFSQFTDYCETPGIDLPNPCVLSYTSDQMLGLERVYALRSAYNIAASNMSLGGGQYTSNCDSDDRKPIIDNLRAADIATVISSGNNAYKNAVGAPACISTAISVGATCDSATAGRGCSAVDDIPDYSNIADFISLLAPGSLISSSTPGTNTFESWHGTSMAAPHVAGAWALLKQNNPGATVSSVLAALQDTGIIVDDQRASGSVTGMKRINVDQVLVPQLAAPAFTYPQGGETLVAGTMANLSWNSGYAPPALVDDMESGAGLWTVTHNAGSLDWVLDNGNPHSGFNAWFAGSPGEISDQLLSSSGPATVPTNAQLRFWHSYDTQMSSDGGVVEISTDGFVWNDLGPYITQAGYNSTISSATGSPIASRQAFSGNSGGYVETRVDLGSFSGQAVYIRFRMASDNSVASTGWFVDDVVLLESASPSDITFDLAYTDNCTADTVFTDDMESGGGLWAVSRGAGSLDWALGTANPRSGSSAWFASDPSTISDQYLSSASLITIPINGQLRFWHSYQTEANYDGGVVEISTDGISWNDLGPYITQAGYNRTISSATGSPIGGRSAFSGNSGDYVETLVDLDSYSGQAVYIRFRMASDSSVSSLGWYLDDVAINNGTAWTPIGMSGVWATGFPWSVPLAAGDDYCLSIEGMATGYLNSPQVISSPFSLVLDSDDDGLTDAEEISLGTDPLNPDSDGDNLTDGEEVLSYGTDPLSVDSDGDGFDDDVEILLYGSDPLDAEDTPANGDVTEDGQTNAGDLVVCTRIALGDIESPSEQQRVRCDMAPVDSVTGIPQPDGLINAADILRLTQAVLQN